MTESKEEKLHELREMARAQLNSMDGVVESATAKSNDTWHFASYYQYAAQYNRLVDEAARVGLADQGVLVRYDMEKMPSPFDTIDMQQRSLFQGVHGNLSMLCASLESKIGDGETSLALPGLLDFLNEKVRPGMANNKPQMERDVQNTVETLLIGNGMQRGVDYDRETGRVKHSGKESVPDFVFLPLSAVLELKLVKEHANVSRVVDEMNADVQGYSKDYEHVLFLVYDLGGIDDVVEFKRDFERNPNVSVLVVKH